MVENPPPDPSPDTPVTVPDQNHRYFHSDIFDRLVTGEKDLPGLLGYAIYQKRKRDWIARFAKKHNVNPTAEEVKAFCFAIGDDEIASYRREAESILTLFSETIADSLIADVKEQALNERIARELTAIIDRLKDLKSLRHHVIGHIVGVGSLVIIYVGITYIVEHEVTIEGIFHWVRGFFRFTT